MDSRSEKGDHGAQFSVVHNTAGQNYAEESQVKFIVGDTINHERESQNDRVRNDQRIVERPGPEPGIVQKINRDIGDDEKNNERIENQRGKIFSRREQKQIGTYQHNGPTKENDAGLKWQTKMCRGA